MISIIVAIANDNVIGKDNKLIWHISEDLKRFKRITNGHKMIMGRKTFQSLPGVLPNREHIIITRDTNFSVDSEQVSICHDLDSLIEKYKNSKEEVLIIGGAEIYTQFLPHADKLYLTRINHDFNGDTHFPKINHDDFEVESTSEPIIDEKNKLEYKFINLIKK